MDRTHRARLLLAGTVCGLFGVEVRGGVTVEPGAGLATGNGTDIRGGVTATAPTQITISDAVVRGGVTVSGGTNVRALTVNGTEVRGDLVLTGNSMDPNLGLDVTIFLQVNIVRGSVVLRDNTATVGGSILVHGNAIEGDLECLGNSPDPTFGFGFPNTVGGAATGECDGLAGP